MCVRKAWSTTGTRQSIGEVVALSSPMKVDVIRRLTPAWTMMTTTLKQLSVLVPSAVISLIIRDIRKSPHARPDN